MARKGTKRVGEALEVLGLLGLPAEQLNDRSALALLALLDLNPARGWDEAQAPLIGITPMMEFAERHYGTRYAPNTRETFRRFTIHQFEQAGVVVANPDKPDRPTNSPKFVYQIEPATLELLRQFGKPAWTGALQAYLATRGTLVQRYAQEREMRRISLQLAPGMTVALSPGGQNVLVRLVIEEFCPRFIPGGMPIYVGDTADKWAHFDANYLAGLGVVVESHGPMPDVVVHYTTKNWLVLIEAVTSHGPVNPKRLAELQELFAGSTAGLVFVSAFLDRPTLNRFLAEIAWGTEVWVADSPDHLIHFNGERFLGPH